MSLASAQSAIKALYELYGRAGPDFRPFIMKKIASSCSVDAVLTFLSDQWNFLPKDPGSISNALEFLCLYTVSVRDKLNNEVSLLVFSLFMLIARNGPLPYSYDSYSRFLTVLIPAVGHNNSHIIQRHLSSLDPEISLFPEAHYVLFYQDGLDAFIQKMLSSVKKNKSITQQSVWNETMCVLLRAKVSKNFDRLKFFSAIDYSLALNGYVDSKINLLSSCFRFFNNLEMAQLMRMHFDTISKKVSQRITLSVLVKLIALACAYYDICENKEELVEIVFQYIMPFFTNNEQIINQSTVLFDKFGQERIDSIINKYKGNINMMHSLLFLASRYPSKETMPLLFEEVDHKMIDIQYDYFVFLVKSGKYDTSLASSLFTMLRSEDFELIPKALNNDKKEYILNAVKFLETNEDKNKLIQILNTLFEMKEIPVLDIDVTECTATVVANYFLNRIEDPKFPALIRYLHECYSKKGGNFKVEEDGKHIFPKFIDDFFGRAEVSNWRNAVFENALQRIRISDRIIVITVIALAEDTTAFIQGVAYCKSDPTVLTAFLTASVANIEEESLKLITELPKKKSNSLLSGIMGTKNVDKDMLKIIVDTFSIISYFIKPTETCFKLLKMMFKQGMAVWDFESLIQSASRIVERLRKKVKLSHIIEKMCTNVGKIDNKIFESCLVSFLKGNNVLKGTTADKVCVAWFSILKDKDLIETSEMEAALLREDYAEVSFPIIMEELHKLIPEKDTPANIFLSFKRVIATGFIKEQYIRREIPAFITNALSEDPHISSFCVEMLRSQLTVGMTIQQSKLETSTVIDTTLPFFNELALRLAFNVEEEVKIIQSVLEIFRRNPTRSQAIFFLAVVAHSPKLVLISYPHILTQFLSANDMKDIVINNALFRVITTLYSSNPLHLLTAILEGGDYKPSMQVIRYLIRGQSFITLLYKAIDNLIENEYPFSYLLKVTTIFKMAVEENIIFADSKSIRALFVLITTFYVYTESATSDQGTAQREALKDLTFAIFTATQRSEVQFDLKNGEKEYISSMEAVVNMLRQLRDDEIKKLSIGMEQLMKTKMFYAFIVYMGLMFSVTPVSDKNYKLTALKCFTNTINDPRLTKPMKTAIIRAISANFTGPLIKKLTKEQVDALFIAQNAAFYSIEAKKLDTKEDGYFNIVMSIDDSVFTKNVAQIVEIANKFHSNNSEVAFSDYFIAVASRVVKLCSPGRTFSGSFPRVLATIGSTLFEDREKAEKVLTAVYGKNFSYEKISDEAMAFANQYYSAFITNAINAVSAKKPTQADDLKVIGELMKPVSKAIDKKNLLDLYTKLLISVATSKDNEISELAVSLIADLAFVNE